MYEPLAARYTTRRMTTATEFLLGARDHQGRTLETYLSADDDWLEDWHDWVQWAFPNQDPSPFNPDAPVWTRDEFDALPSEARVNLLRLLARYRAFLDAMTCWRSRFDHNHARITRVLLCLRDAGLRDEAREFHAFVTSAPEPGTRSRMFWLDALEG